MEKKKKFSNVKYGVHNFDLGMSGYALETLETIHRFVFIVHSFMHHFMFYVKML